MILGAPPRISNAEEHKKFNSAEILSFNKSPIAFSREIFFRLTRSCVTDLVLKIFTILLKLSPVDLLIIGASQAGISNL